MAATGLDASTLMPALKTFATLPRPDNPQLAEAVADSIRLGHPIDTAGQLAGLGKTVAWDWLRQGEAQLAAGDEQGSHASFAKAVKDAEAEMVDNQLRHINRDASQKGGWAAAMTLLERRRPKDFGRNQQIQVEATVTHVHELGPAAQKAIAAHILSLEEAHPPTDLDTGGLETPTTPLLAEGRSGSTD